MAAPDLLGMNTQERILLHNRGLRFLKTGQIESAIDIYTHILSKVPDDAQAHANRAVCHLLLGNYEQGWPEFEWRLKTPQMRVRSTGTPRWTGTPLDGKTILVICEQGYGDTLQFVRYVRYVKERNKFGTVLLGVRPELTRILAGCKGVDRVVNVLPPPMTFILP